MHIYYVAGVPYSDELYHHGTKGMKWGRRLYQYANGSLTPLGRIHYGVKDASKAIVKRVGGAAKRYIDKRTEKYKRAHPWTMSKEELNEYTNRLIEEKNYIDLKRQTKSRGREVVGDILSTGAKILASKAFEAIGNNIVSKEKAKADAKYETKMTKSSAKNKLLYDEIIDKGQRKRIKNDASFKLMQDVQKNYGTMSVKDIQDSAEKWENLKKMENRFGMTSNSNNQKKKSKP